MAKRKRLKKAQRQRKVELQEGSSYEARNKFLAELRFKDYKSYLKSKLWAKVRAKVFKKKGRVCEICHAHATEVHHSRYHKNDLLGRNLKFLHPICGDCHKNIEFDGEKKLTLKRAVEKQGVLKERAEKDRAVQEYIEEEYGYLDQEFFGMRF